MVRSELEQRVEIAQEALRQAVGQLDPDGLTPHEAGRLLEAFDRVVRTAATGATLLARRVEDGQEWRRQGYRSAAEWLAAKTGSSLGAARRKVETSKALKDLPSTRTKMTEGTISPEQGETIAGAAKANPGAEQRLLRKARRPTSTSCATKPCGPRLRPTGRRSSGTSGCTGSAGCAATRTVRAPATSTSAARSTTWHGSRPSSTGA